MIVLNGTLCSNNFRKVGIIQACINLAIQILSLIILLKVVIEASPRKRGYYIHGHRVNKSEEKPITHVLIDIMFFVVIDIIAYLFLIIGLCKKKQSIITGWLIYSIMELIVVVLATFYFAVYITITSHYEASVLGLILPILVTIYMVYNMCVIYTIRHRMNEDRNDALRENPNAFSIHSSPPHVQCRIPHRPIVLTAQNTQKEVEAPPSSCSFTISPPPYRETNT